MDYNKFPFGIKLFNIELNKKCSAHCSYCRITSQGKPFEDKEMKKDTLITFYKSLLSNPPVGEEYYNIEFDETEPLFNFSLVKEMFEMFPIERKNRFFHSFTTNGLLLNEEILKFCKDHQIVVKISTDGTPENCMKQKGIDINDTVNLCKNMNMANLICYSYVITPFRLKFLQEDLEAVFEYYRKSSGEWSFLIDTISDWTTREYKEAIDKVENFMSTHWIKASHYHFKDNWHFDSGLGLRMEIDGNLSTWPLNKSCQPPVDKDFINNYRQKCGNIFSPNMQKIQTYVTTYGEDFQNTNRINKNCDGCVNYSICHHQNAKATFTFSDKDCLNHRFHAIIRRYIMSKQLDYDEIISNVSLNGVCLNLTNACNMRCKYCFTHPNTQVMDFATAQSAVMWIKANQGKATNTHINFFGGEPMLHYEDIIKPLILWSEKMGITGVTFGMTSNGTLFTEERIDWLSDHGVSLLLSIDGGPETQNLTRPLLSGEDSFMAVAKNIPHLLEKFPDLTFRSTFNKESAGKIFENYLWAEKLGFSSFYTMPNEFEEWDDEKITEMAIQLRKLYWHMYEGITAQTRVPIFNYFFKELFSMFGFEATDTERPYLRCGLGTSSIGIGVNGELFGCQEHNSYDTNTPFYLGNIFKDGIEKERHERLLHMYLDTLPKNYGHACPSHCFGVNGDLTKTTKVFKAYSGTTISTITEILLHAASNNNQAFLNFIKTHKEELV